MKIYIAYDTNINGNGNEEYDIANDDYIELLQTCFKYCTSFSFRLRGEKASKLAYQLPSELEKYQIETTPHVLPAYSHYYREFSPVVKNEIYCYKACLETYNLICSICNSVFTWISCNCCEKPEDLAFYREDGSVFFNSTVHEGNCELHIQSNENVDSIVKNPIWTIK